jgi:hypothetical protein
MVVGEMIVLGYGIWLAPRGIFDRQFFRSLGPALASAAAMVVVARLLDSMNPFVAAPVAVAAYVGCLWMTGGLHEAVIAELREFVASKLSRLRPR